MTGCILLNFYIKPQHKRMRSVYSQVVSYWISTSNHNYTHVDCSKFMLYLIEFLHQTTTFKFNYIFIFCCILLNFYIKPQLSSSITFSYFVVSYWISTSNHNFCSVLFFSLMLYLIEFLHQTTTYGVILLFVSGCILLNFYIKPQL